MLTQFTYIYLLIFPFCTAHKSIRSQQQEKNNIHTAWRGNTCINNQDRPPRQANGVIYHQLWDNRYKFCVCGTDKNIISNWFPLERSMGSALLWILCMLITFSPHADQTGRLINKSQGEYWGKVNSSFTNTNSGALKTNASWRGWKGKTLLPFYTFSPWCVREWRSRSFRRLNASPQSGQGNGWLVCSSLSKHRKS